MPLPKQEKKEKKKLLIVAMALPKMEKKKLNGIMAMSLPKMGGKNKFCCQNLGRNLKKSITFTIFL